MKAALAPILALSLCVLAVAEPRTWTSSDGKKIEAEFIESDGETVTIRRDDGKKFTLPLDRFSEADRKFVAEQRTKKTPTSKSATSGVTGELKYPEDGSEVKRDLDVRGRTKGAPKGYVAMAFRRDIKKDYLLPNTEYSRPNKTFSTTIYHGPHELGEWEVQLCVLPEDDAKELADWMKHVVSLYEKGQMDKVKPYDEKLISKSVQVASAKYFLRSK